ncbi:MAG: peptide chain release factor N(5)-glutamine methyltransferase [Oscillospiraceae bacterium]
MVESTYKSTFSTVCEMIKPSTEDYIFEATELCCHFLSVSKMEFITTDLPVEKTVYDKLINAAKTRAKGYPLQYIIGEWEFYGRKFDVGEGVLIPRADTETLIDVVLEYAKDKQNLKVVDLCSGSGCIAVTIAKGLSNVEVYAIEKSEEAYDYLLKNIKKNTANVNPKLADVLTFDENLSEFDIVVSNPPYLTNKQMKTLQKEVGFEPEMALYGQDDGLFFYKEITKLWKNRIKTGGLLAYEIGQGQENAVTAILNEHGFKTICQRADLCDIIRVIYGIKN